MITMKMVRWWWWWWCVLQEEKKSVHLLVYCPISPSSPSGRKQIYYSHPSPASSLLPSPAPLHPSSHLITRRISSTYMWENILKTYGGNARTNTWPRVRVAARVPDDPLFTKEYRKNKGIHSCTSLYRIPGCSSLTFDVFQYDLTR